MARISSYSQDPNLEGADRVIGTDASNANATVNFSLDSLGDFFVQSGIADATRLGYRFRIDGVNETTVDPIAGGGVFNFSGTNRDLAELTSIRISASDLAGFGTGVLDGFISGQRIKIVSTRAQGQETVAQGFFAVTSIDPLHVGTVVVGYQLNLTAEESAQEGSIRYEPGIDEPDVNFLVLPLPGGSGTGSGGQGDPGLPVSSANFVLDAVTGDSIVTFATDIDPNIGVVRVQRGTPGADGQDGAPGADGADGAPGADGADGISAYQVAVNNGFVGTETEWLASLVGAAGADGEAGEQGIQGFQGDGLIIGTVTPGAGPGDVTTFDILSVDIDPTTGQPVDPAVTTTITIQPGAPGLDGTSDLPDAPTGIDENDTVDYVLRLTDVNNVESLDWAPVSDSGQTVTDTRLPFPTTGTYLVGNGAGTAWTSQTAAELADNIEGFLPQDNISTRNLTDWPLAGTATITSIGSEVFDDTAINDNGDFLGAILNGSVIELELADDYSSVGVNDYIAGGLADDGTGIPSWIAHVTSSDLNSTGDRTVINATLIENITVVDSTDPNNPVTVAINSLNEWTTNTDPFRASHPAYRRAETQVQRQALFNNLFEITIRIEEPGVVFEDGGGNLNLVGITGTVDAGTVITSQAYVDGQITATDATVAALDLATDKYVDHEVTVTNDNGDAFVSNDTDTNGVLYGVEGLKANNDWVVNDRGYILGYDIADDGTHTIGTIANFRVNQLVGGSLSITLTEIIRSGEQAHTDWSIYPGYVTAAGTGGGSGRSILGATNTVFNADNLRSEFNSLTQNAATGATFSDSFTLTVDGLAIDNSNFYAARGMLLRFDRVVRPAGDAIDNSTVWFIGRVQSFARNVGDSGYDITFDIVTLSDRLRSEDFFTGQMTGSQFRATLATAVDVYDNPSSGVRGAIHTSHLNSDIAHTIDTIHARHLLEARNGTGTSVTDLANHVQLNIDLNVADLQLRAGQVGSTAFDVHTSQFQTYIGQYLKINSYEPGSDPTTELDTFFVGRVDDFTRTETDLLLTLGNIGITDPIRNLGLAHDTSDTDGDITHWFIEPASALDTLDLVKGQAIDYISPTWLADLTTNIGTDNIEPLIFQRQTVGGEETREWVLPATTITDSDTVIPTSGAVVDYVARFQEHIDVSSNVPLTIGGITDIDNPTDQTYEVTYTLVETVNAVALDFRGVQSNITVNPAFSLTPGTYTVNIQFQQDAIETLRRITGHVNVPVYTNDNEGLRLAITASDGFEDHYNAHYFQGGSHAASPNNYIVGITTTDRNIAIHRRGLEDISINNFFPAVPVPYVNADSERGGYLQAVNFTLSTDGNTLTLPSVDGTERTFTGGGSQLHNDVTSNAPLTFREFVADTNYEITYTLADDVTGPITLDLRGTSTADITFDQTPPITQGTHTIRFSVSTDGVRNLVTNHGGDPTYTDDVNGLRLNTGDGSINAHHVSTSGNTPTANNYVISGTLDANNNLVLTRNNGNVPNIDLSALADSDFTPVSFVDNPALDPNPETLAVRDSQVRDGANSIVLTTEANIDRLVGSTFTLTDAEDTTRHVVIRVNDAVQNTGTPITFAPDYAGTGIDFSSDSIAFQSPTPTLTAEKIYTGTTLSTDQGNRVVTKDYVDTIIADVAGGGTPFTSETIVTAPFNFAYTLEQYNEVFGTTLAPLNLNAVETATITPVLDGSDFVGNGAINTALNEYENTSSTVLTASERTAITAAVEPNADGDIIGGALVTFRISDGTEVPLFVQKNATTAAWEWVHGDLPQATTINAVASVSYFDTIIPTFNDVNRLPFALVGDAQTIADNIAIINGAELLEFSISPFTERATVTSATLLEDAFGQYYRLEFSEPYRGSNEYNLDGILRLHTAQRDQVIASGSLSGAVSQDGTPAYVPGALYRETGFDAEDNYSSIEPITFDGTHTNVKLINKVGNGSYDQISINNPLLGNLSNRVTHLEQGGEGSDSYTPEYFGVFPSPFAHNNAGDYYDRWTYQTTTISGNNAATFNQTVQTRTSFYPRAVQFGVEWTQRSYPQSGTFTPGTTRIRPNDPGTRFLYLALEMMYGSISYLPRGGQGDNAYVRTPYGNADNFTRVVASPTDIEYLDPVNNTYNTDLIVSFGGNTSIEHQFNLGLIRVSTGRGTGTAASYYEIQNGTIPFTLSTGWFQTIFVAWLRPDAANVGQLIRQGGNGIPVLATNPIAESDSNAWAQIRIYSLSADQRTSLIDGFRAGTAATNRLLSISGKFIENVSGTEQGVPVPISTLIVTNASDADDNLVSQATIAIPNGGGTINYVDIQTTVGVVMGSTRRRNIDTVDLSPYTLAELWSGADRQSSLSLHTLLGTRDSNVYTTSINREWLSEDLPSTENNQVLTWDINSSTAVWEDPAGGGIVQSIAGERPGNAITDGFTFRNNELEFFQFQGVSNTFGGGVTGFLPGPGAGNGNNFLRGDGTWQSIGLITGDDNVASNNIIPRSDGVAYVGSTLENEIVDILSNAATEVNYEDVDASTAPARVPNDEGGIFFQGLFNPRTGASLTDVTNSILIEAVGLQYTTGGVTPQTLQLLANGFYLADGNAATPTAASNLRRLTLGGSLGREITAITPVTLPSGSGNRPISGIINFRQVDDVSTWHNTVNVGPFDLETIPAELLPGDDPQDIVPQIDLNGNVIVRHGNITGDGSGLTNISEDSLLNLGTGTGPGVIHWTYSIDASLEGNAGDISDRLSVAHQIITRAATAWEGAAEITSFTDADGNNPTIGPPASIIANGDIIRVVNINNTGTFDRTYTYGGADLTFGSNTGFRVSDFVLHQNSAGQVLTSDGSRGFRWVDQSAIAQTHTTGGDLDIAAIDDTFVRPLLGKTSNPTTVSSSTNLTYVDSTGTLSATAFVGDGAGLDNVGDRFASASLNGSGDGLTFNTVVSTPSLAFDVDPGLSWQRGNLVHFTIVYTDARGTERTEVYQGGIRAYNQETGAVTLGPLGGAWIPIAGAALFGEATVNVLSIAQPGFEGPQGPAGQDGTDGIDGTNGAMGERGFVGPFVSSIYFVRNNGEADPDRSTLPNQNLVAESGFSGTQNTVSWDRFENRLTGGSGNGRNAIVHSAPVAGSGFWYSERPDTINSDVFVTQLTVTQAGSSAFGTTQFGGIFAATEQGPAGPPGPEGMNARNPDFNAFTISTLTAVMVDSGSGFNAITGPIAEDDSIRIRFPGVDGLDLENGSSVTFRISSGAQTIFAWGQVANREADVDNTYSEFTIRVRRIDQDTTTTGYPVGSAANMALAGFIGREGNSHLSELQLTTTTETIDTETITTRTLSPVTGTDNLNLTGGAVTTDASIHVLENSVVPFSLVVDWVLYTSSRTVTTLANPIDIGSATNVTVIQYENNARIPGVWQQLVGVSYDGADYVNDPNSNTFRSGNVIITI